MSCKSCSFTESYNLDNAIQYNTTNTLMCSYGMEVDMWAIGVITYIILCGFPPFAVTNKSQVRYGSHINAF